MHRYMLANFQGRRLSVLTALFVAAFLLALPSLVCQIHAISDPYRITANPHHYGRMTPLMM